MEFYKLSEEFKEEFEVSYLEYIPEVPIYFSFYIKKLNFLILVMTSIDDSGKLSIWSLATLKKIKNIYDNGSGTGAIVWDPVPS